MTAKKTVSKKIVTKPVNKVTGKAVKRNSGAQAAPIKGKINTELGRGKPGAKSGKNPQPTLDRKAEIAIEEGGTFGYSRADRRWEINCNGHTALLTPDEVAALSYNEFAVLCRSGKSKAI
jgi:hypothetical protein